MTKERIANLRKQADLPLGEKAVNEMLDEIERLQSENERLARTIRDYLTTQSQILGAHNGQS
jgi:hypothetical protein